jgi:hypothetical protein
MTDKTQPKHKRRSADLEKRGRFLDAPIAIKKILLDFQINPAIPWALISDDGQIYFAGPRMLSLLGLDRRGSLTFPLTRENWESHFHFFTEEHSKQALLEKILVRIAEEKSLLTMTENRLKTFRVFLKPLKELGAQIRKTDWMQEILGVTTKPRKGKLALLFVELVRPGDLMKDADARQALFRSFAHELRTSVMSLSGMIEIALSSPKPAEQLSRMKESVKRLERLVDRLGDLRARLGIDDDALNKVQKGLKKI